MTGGRRHLGRWLMVVLGVAVVLSACPVSAKGGAAPTSATVDHAGWGGPRRVALHLPDDYDELVEVIDAEWREARDQPIMRRADAAIGDQLPYAITLHYEFTDSGHGARDWEGRFDGDRTLYFPSAMVVGNGIWQAGWYEANPLLAEALRRAIDGSPAPVARLPRAGTGPADAHPPVRVAFLRGGDLYVLDTAQQRERRLTDDGSAATPWWSGDGRALFFRRAAPATPPGMWRWRADAGLTPVGGNDVQEHWAPDGTAVAVMEPRTARWQQDAGWTETRVWLERGGARWALTPAEPDVRWEPLAWSPDGRRLALVRLTFGSQVVKGLPIPLAGASLWVTDGDLRAATLRELPLPATFRGARGIPDVAMWSPDGRFLTLGMGPDIPCASCRADGTMWQVVPVDGGPPVALDSGLTRFGAVAWAPDGRFVVLSAPGGRETYRHKQLVRFDPVSGHRQDLSRDRRWADLAPAVSPDGRWVAFVRGRSIDALVTPGSPTAGAQANLDAIRSRRLWMMGADGGGARQVTDAPGWTDEAPVWSPDGQWLVFVRWRPAAGNTPAAAQLWAVRPDGSDAQPLVTDLDLPPGLDTGFGYYGAVPWWDLFAAAPAPGLPASLPHAGAGPAVDAHADGSAFALTGLASLGAWVLALWTSLAARSPKNRA